LIFLLRKENTPRQCHGSTSNACRGPSELTSPVYNTGIGAIRSEIEVRDSRKPSKKPEKDYQNRHYVGKDLRWYPDSNPAKGKRLDEKESTWLEGRPGSIPAEYLGAALAGDWCARRAQRRGEYGTGWAGRRDAEPWVGARGTRVAAGHTGGGATVSAGSAR
jgi:hypothetical protein